MSKQLPSVLWFSFESIIPKVLDHNDVHTWSQRCSKFSANNYEAPWQRHLKDTLQLNILWTSVSSLHQDIELFILCFSFSQTSLVFKFNLMMVEHFLPQFIYFSIFWYCILKFIQCLYAFFIRASKFSWASVLFFVKVYSYKMLLYFYFPWNISTC